MPVFRTDRNETYEDGALVSFEEVQVDVTREVRGGTAEEQVRAAITELTNLRQLAANRNTVSNIGQADNQLAAVADAITLISTVLINVLRYDVLPDLLEDDALSGELDG